GDEVVAVVTKDRVSSTVEAVFEVVAVGAVVTVAAADRVGTAEAVDRVVAAKADDHVGARRAVQLVVAVGADDRRRQPVACWVRSPGPGRPPDHRSAGHQRSAGHRRSKKYPSPQSTAVVGEGPQVLTLQLVSWLAARSRR